MTTAEKTQAIHQKCVDARPVLRIRHPDGEDEVKAHLLEIHLADVLVAIKKECYPGLNFEAYAAELTEEWDMENDDLRLQHKGLIEHLYAFLCQ